MNRELNLEIKASGEEFIWVVNTCKDEQDNAKILVLLYSEP